MASKQLKEVYVVLGNQGEYSDRVVWVVAVFQDEGEARSVVETLGEEDHELEDWYSDAIYYHVHTALMVCHAV